MGQCGCGQCSQRCERCCKCGDWTLRNDGPAVSDVNDLHERVLRERYPDTFSSPVKIPDHAGASHGGRAPQQPPRVCQDDADNVIFAVKRNSFHARALFGAPYVADAHETQPRTTSRSRSANDENLNLANFDSKQVMFLRNIENCPRQDSANSRSSGSDEGAQLLGRAKLPLRPVRCPLSEQTWFKV